MRGGGARLRAAMAAAALAVGAPAWPAQPLAAGAAPPDGAVATATPPATRSGREIYERFRDGLADPTCPGGGSSRWREHYAAAPRRMANGQDDVLPLLGYVVDALREASLPTEYALIPFVESRYRPAARSPGGPAGLWQFIALTARNHHVPMRPGYDGRLSPVDSTRAAVRYLKTLHGMFAGDWRLAVMAYNAGEYRVLGALRRAGQNARNARPETLPGLSGITYAYVQKLKALSCLMQQADDREEWLQALDRPVPVLAAQPVSGDARDLAGWASARGLDAAMVRRLNPAFLDGRLVRLDPPLRVLAPLAPAAEAVVDRAEVATPEVATPATATVPAGPAGSTPASAPDVQGVAAVAGAAVPAMAASAWAPAASASQLPPAATRPGRWHTVARGESAWAIAHRYGIATGDLLARNRLDARARLQPGMVLAIDQEAAAAP